MTCSKPIFTGLVSIFVLVACSSDSGDDEKKAADKNNPGGSNSGTGGAPLTADERACEELYKAQISFSRRCGGALSEAESALARFRKLCAREVAAPGADQLREARARCAERRLTAACDEEVPECDLPEGTLPDGAPCAVRGQCRSRFCKVTDKGGCGTCAPRVDPGGACTAPTDCAIGKSEIASCDFRGNGDTGTCSTWKLESVGGACGTDGFCGFGAYCPAPETEGGPGRCEALKGEGDACSSSFMCKGELVCAGGACGPRPDKGGACEGVTDCAGGLACGSDGTCQEIVYVTTGQECDAVRRCERGRCVQQVMQGEDGQPTATGPATCVAPLADGDACGPNDQGLACDHFARCVGGRCVLSDPAACQ